MVHVLRIPIQRTGALALFLSLAVVPGSSQQSSFTKYFKQFSNVVAGVDFFSGSRAEASVFEKQVSEARQRLADLIGGELARGAIVICSSLEQKDSVSEARVLKMGYSWALIVLTPEATQQQMLASVKAQMGDQLPPGILERFKNPSPEMKTASQDRLISLTVQRMSYAILSTTLAPEKAFRSSRLDDMGRSPLSDWLDVGLASYASGGAGINIRFLQEHLEEAFPIEDVLIMARPFVAPSSGDSPGGERMVIRTFGAAAGGEREGGGREGGGSPQQGGGRGRGGPGGMSLPKDVQDRMTYDAQAATFFSFLIEKLGMQKMKEVVQWDRQGKNARDILTRADMLGPDLDQAEKDWQAYVKARKVEGPGGFQMIVGAPGRQPGASGLE